MSAQGLDDKRAGADHYCENLVREGDHDRWLAALFAPADKRPRLLAIYAFNLEIAQIRDRAKEPRLGEIRLQWWRDALAGEARSQAIANPVCAALFETIERFNLPRGAFLDLISAREFDLWDDPMPSLRDLEVYCALTSSALLRLASLVLANGVDPGGADAAGRAGLAYAFTGLLRALSWRSAQGQIYVPADVLARHGAAGDDLRARRTTADLLAALAEMRVLARDHLGHARAALPQMDEGARAALAPLALVEPYLRTMEKRGYDPFASEARVPSWRKIAALWRWSRSA